jgi:hypothetical protein
MSNGIETKRLPYRADLRVDTGPTQFGDDWPGVFIRGDDAFHFATCIGEFLALYEFSREQTIHIEALKALLETCIWRGEEE